MTPSTLVCTPGQDGKPTLSRRKCLGYGLVALGWPALAVSDLSAQPQAVSPLLTATRTLSPMAGISIPEERLQNATALLGVILDISKELRAIDLGEIEPATVFAID